MNKISKLLIIIIFLFLSASCSRITYTPAQSDDDNVISTKIISDVGYIKIDSFMSIEIDRLFLDAYRSLNCPDKLVIDLRDNKGGYFKAGTNLASLFLEKNKIICHKIYKHKKKIVYSHNDIIIDCKIVILVNGRTASASETFTVALKENNKAYVIRVKTYGKGCVNDINGNLLYYVMSPFENTINNGICPHEYIFDRDEQLDTAIKYSI